MRLLLQQRPDGREAPRFVQLMLEPDLLGGWSLVRETGQIGGRSQLRREQYLDQISAQAAFESHARDQQLRKGFQLMFAQGAEARNNTIPLAIRVPAAAGTVRSPAIVEFPVYTHRKMIACCACCAVNPSTARRSG